MGIVKPFKIAFVATDHGDCCFEMVGFQQYGVHSDMTRVTLWRDGFEASRLISRKELEAVRDWCNVALAWEDV